MNEHGDLMLNQLENAFHDAMLNIYRQAKSEANYNARYLIQMVETYGGVEAARMLINATTVSVRIHRALGAESSGFNG